MAEADSTQPTLWDTGEPVKRCRKCKKVKPVDDFDVHFCKRRKKNYRQRQCRECVLAGGRVWRSENAETLRARRRRHYEANTEEAREYARQWAKTHRAEVVTARRRLMTKPDSRAQRLFTAAKNRAEKQGVPFTISLEWVTERVRRGICEVTGIPFDLESQAVKGIRCGPWAPSLDRTDPTKGYTFDNVRVVVWMYNLSKNKWDHSDVMALARALVRQEEGNQP